VPVNVHLPKESLCWGMISVCVTMALPKKRKFLRFAISKLNAIRSAYKRRAVAFSKGQPLKVSNSFFSRIESAITSCLFSYTTVILKFV